MTIKKKMIIAIIIFLTITLASAVNKLRQELPLRSWHSVMGTIESFEYTDYGRMDNSVGKKKTYEVKVSYTYEVDGKVFHSTRTAIDDQLILTLTGISEHFGLDHKQCKVWYNPTNPSSSVLVLPEWIVNVSITVIISLLLIVCIIWAFKTQ